MAYTRDIAVLLGSANSGKTDLRAQLVDTSGTNVGSAVSTGFVEIGTSGSYLWHYASFPDAHRGGVKFYSNAASSTILAFTEINPEETELMRTALTESYAADGAAPTPAQALFLIMQMLTEMTITGTTMAIKKLDGTTTAATFTLNSTTVPSSITRAS